jgi:hypothetical protein
MRGGSETSVGWSGRRPRLRLLIVAGPADWDFLSARRLTSTVIYRPRTRHGYRRCPSSKTLKTACVGSAKHHDLETGEKPASAYIHERSWARPTTRWRQGGICRDYGTRLRNIRAANHGRSMPRFESAPRFVRNAFDGPFIGTRAERLLNIGGGSLRRRGGTANCRRSRCKWRPVAVGREETIGDPDWV